MKRIIVINWRWHFLGMNSQDEKSLIKGDDEIVLVKYSNKDWFNKKITQILAKNSKNSIECIIMTHYSNESKCRVKIPKEDIEKPEKFEGGFFVFEFGSGKGKIYNGDVNPEGLFVPNDEGVLSDIIKIDNFQIVWDYYRYKLNFILQKNRLIDSFFPLILDIKGLGETTDPIRKEEYRKEILNAIGKEFLQPIAVKKKSDIDERINVDIGGYGNELISSWDKIKEILELKTDSKTTTYEILPEEYKVVPKTDYYFSLLESEEKPGFTVSDIRGLFEEGSKDKSEDAINWFNKIIDILDKKILLQTQPGSSIP
jgi:hypothetical protein